MNERKCGYKIIAFVNGKKQEIPCDPNTGCLKELVWCGIGVRRAAALALGRGAKGIEACVERDCKNATSSDSLQR